MRQSMLVIRGERKRNWRMSRLRWYGPRRPWRMSSRKTFSRKSIHTEISPLRCAPVEMTKGRAALPGTVVAEQESPKREIAEPQAPPTRCTPVEKRFQERTADLSTTLRSGRDDKGEGGAS